MTDETTRLINEETAQKELSKTQNATKTSPMQPTQKNGKKGNSMASAAGGFVAGAAVGVGATAVAQNQPEPQEVVEDVDEKIDNQNEDIIETPAPEEVILANDEGIRYAHVDADNFNDAFAQARAQVGAGGVFEYNGKLYGTYLADEWDAMSPQERADYQNRVNEVAPSHQTETSHSHAVETPIDTHEATPDVVPTNVEMISTEPVDNEIRVLGVEAVQDNDGNILNVALVESNGDQAILVDVDNNGTIDVLLHDDNADGQLQENEIHDISDAGIEVADLVQAQIASDGDLLYASNDDMPDYINDADSIITV